MPVAVEDRSRSRRPRTARDAAAARSASSSTVYERDPPAASAETIQAAPKHRPGADLADAGPAPRWAASRCMQPAPPPESEERSIGVYARSTSGGVSDKTSEPRRPRLRTRRRARARLVVTASTRSSSSPRAASSTKTTRRPRRRNPRIAASSQTSVATPKTTISSGSSTSSSGSVFGFVNTLKFFFRSRISLRPRRAGDQRRRVGQRARAAAGRTAWSREPFGAEVFRAGSAVDRCCGSPAAS